MRVFFHPEAQEELDRSLDWYSERSDIVSRAFVQETKLCIRKIQAYPRRSKKYTSETRQFLYPNFPFRIIYRETEKEIQIVAIAHHRRLPGYWKRRV